MNGLQSLMQGMPQGQQGMPQGQQGMPQQGMPQGMPQPQQAPAMPNDPRMGAAMGLVDDSIEKFNLDPQTEVLMLQNQALALLQAADNVGKMSAPQQDTNIKEQTTQGIAGMLQSLAPGMQQRGQQMQQAQARPPMPQQAQARPPMGGMPSMGAPNMRGMANGGIVGYAGPDGSQVGMKPTLGAVPPSAVGDEQIKQFAAQYTALQAGLAAATTPEDKAQSQRLIQDLIRDMGNQHATVMQYIDSTKGFVAPRTSGMARGGIIGYRPGGEVKGYAGPNGSQVGYDYSKDPNLYAPTEIAQPDDAILEFARKQMQRDAGAEAVTAGERLRELTGAEDLMAQRTKAQEALQAQREARFNPEESKRRRWQAGLAGLAERGLGGFGAGRTAEMDKILGEKLSAAEASVADMDKLISELRELGMGQFEAEKQAREMVEKGVNQGLSASAAVADSRQRARDAAANRITQERGQDMTAETQRYVADANAARTSAQERAIAALMAEAMAAGVPISEAQATRDYFGMQPSMYSVGQRGDEALLRLRQQIGEDVDKLLRIGEMDFGLGGPEARAYREAEAAGDGSHITFRQNIIDQRVAAAESGSAPAGGSSTGPTEELTSSTVPTEGNLYTRNGVTYIYTNGAFTPQ